MYSVHVSGRAGERKESGAPPDSEIIYTHKQRRREPLPLRFFNYIRHRFVQPEPQPGKKDTKIVFYFLQFCSFFL